METDTEKLSDFRKALEILLENPDDFRVVAKAVEERDTKTYQAVLSKHKIIPVCLWICRWFCTKITVFICKRFCPEDIPFKDSVEEMMEFAQVTLRITEDPKKFREILNAYNTQDIDKWQDLINEHKLRPFCRQLCRWFSYYECTRICQEFCPPMPEITRVGRIPRGQIDTHGYADGPSYDGTSTPNDDLSEGRGDHPFGGYVLIEGVFHISSPEKYRAEYSHNLSIWTPIMTKIKNKKPCINSGNLIPDSTGWYQISDMCDPQFLTIWKTHGMDKKFHIRLTVHSAGSDFHSDAVAVMLDNTYPKVDLKNLMILSPDNDLEEIVCKGIKKGQGKIRITYDVQDTNFAYLSIVAEGQSSTTLQIYSKSYAGNPAMTGETGYIDWEPWTDSNFKPCCYLIRLTVWARSIINNMSFTHGNHRVSRFQAVEIT